MPDLSQAPPPRPLAAPPIAPGPPQIARLFRHRDGDIAALQLMTLLRAYRNAVPAADPATRSIAQAPHA